MTPLKKAQKKYEGRRNVKKVSFNLDSDSDLIAFLDNKEFSSYVKHLIRSDMQSCGFSEVPEVPEVPESSDAGVLCESPPKPVSELERYRNLLLRAFNGEYSNFPTDISHLTVDIINSMSVSEIREYTGYV